MMKSKRTTIGYRIYAAFLSMLVTLVSFMLFLSGCGSTGSQNETSDEWYEYADLENDMTEEELYEGALKEDILIVYTVSTRATKTKEVFEKEYPGLCVEIRDLRSPDLIEAVKENYCQGKSDCDIVICNDNSGDFKSTLVDTGIVVPYIPHDIKDKLKPGHIGETLTFLDEAEIIFYNPDKSEKAPIENIWELTDEKYRGRLYLPNPLRSFSTYAFASSVFDHEDELKEAYKEYFGTDYLGEDDIAESFWKMTADNAVFTNSSDEVMEALNTGDADIGIMVSSKLRYKDVGYSIEPIYNLKPFSGCRTSYCAMIARNSKNICQAKLFIRCLLGGTDGTGDGYKPFNSPGTWSARNDVADGNDIPLNECDLMIPDQESLIKNRQYRDAFWASCLKEREVGQTDR